MTEYCEGFWALNDVDKIAFLAGNVIYDATEDEKENTTLLERQIMNKIAETVPELYQKYQIRIKSFVKRENKPYRVNYELYTISKVKDFIVEGPDRL